MCTFLSPTASAVNTLKLRALQDDIPLNGKTMRKLLPVAAAVGLMIGNPVHATGLNLALSNETANIELFSPFSQIDEGGQLSLGVFYNDLDDVILHSKLVAVGVPTSTRIPYKLAFGAKAYLGEIKDGAVDAGALAIGGSINIQYPLGYNPVDLTIEGFFTPGITTFGDTESLIEIGAMLSIEIVPQAKAFVGYRLLEIEDKANINWELDDNVHFGIRFQF